MPPDFDDELLTVEEAAKLLKLEPFELQSMLRKHKIPSVRLSRTKWRVRRSVVDHALRGGSFYDGKGYGKEEFRDLSG